MRLYSNCLIQMEIHLRFKHGDSWTFKHGHLHHCTTTTELYFDFSLCSICFYFSGINIWFRFVSEICSSQNIIGSVLYCGSCPELQKWCWSECCETEWRYKEWPGGPVLCIGVWLRGELLTEKLHWLTGLVWKFNSISALYWLCARAAISDPSSEWQNYSRTFALFGREFLFWARY